MLSGRMRGLVRVSVLAGILGACGGRASRDEPGSPEMTGGAEAGAVAGAKTTGGVAPSSGGTAFTGGVPGAGGTGGRSAGQSAGMNAAAGRNATGGRPPTGTSDGSWGLNCPHGADTPRFRRLTARDLVSTLREALEISGPELTSPSDWPISRFDLGRNPPLGDALAWLVALADEHAREYAAAHADACSDAAACRARLEELGLRLFRRPLRIEELESLQELFESVQAEADETAALEEVVRAMILSPHFTFRIETTVSTPEGVRWSAYTLAARLAYFLWRSGPDAELLEAAAEVDSNSDLDFVIQQTQRLLDDPRASSGFAAVVGEWLRISPTEPSAGAPVPEGVPVTAMDAQTSEFLDALWNGGQASLHDLLLASWSPLNAELAEYYGAPSDGLGSVFTRVELDPDRFSGILTHGAYLLSARTPSTRGLRMLETLMCFDFPPPIQEEQLPEGDTRRERYEAISNGAACRACHEHLDPLGFALEGFDGWGAPQDSPTHGFVRVLDNQENRHFDGPRGLGELLASSEQVSQCVVRRFLEYALDGTPNRQILLQSGAGNPAPPPPSEPPPPDSPARCLADAFYAENGDLHSLLAGIPLSGVFRNVDTELEPPAFRSSGRTALEHAAETAEFLAGVEPRNVGTTEMLQYAEGLAALATEAP